MTGQTAFQTRSLVRVVNVVLHTEVNLGDYLRKQLFGIRLFIFGTKLFDQRPCRFHFVLVAQTTHSILTDTFLGGKMICHIELFFHFNLRTANIGIRVENKKYFEPFTERP